MQFSQKYYIGGGNNYQIVKSVIKQRCWWTPAKVEDFSEANFIWTSWKKDKHISYLRNHGKNDLETPHKIYSRMDNNKQLTNKKGVFINMREYYKAVGVDPFSILPKTYLVKSCNDEEFRQFTIQYNAHSSLVKKARDQRKAEIKEHLEKKKAVM